jgi:hypothetical protein
MQSIAGIVIIRECFNVNQIDYHSQLNAITTAYFGRLFIWISLSYANYVYSAMKKIADRNIQYHYAFDHGYLS